MRKHVDCATLLAYSLYIIRNMYSEVQFKSIDMMEWTHTLSVIKKWFVTDFQKAVLTAYKWQKLQEDLLQN